MMGRENAITKVVSGPLEAKYLSQDLTPESAGSRSCRRGDAEGDDRYFHTE